MLSSTAVPIENLTVDTDAEIRRRVLAQLEAMSSDELRIATKTQESLSYFIALAAHQVALALGYLIVLPLAWAVRLSEEVASGFTEGWRKGWESTRFRL
jgi:hypothetical protein